MRGGEADVGSRSRCCVEWTTPSSSRSRARCASRRSRRARCYSGYPFPHPAVRSHVPLACAVMSGTDVQYGATRCPVRAVLRWAMVLWGVWH
eukprot:1415302-Rhodomonas_salina.1